LIFDKALTKNKFDTV